MLASRWQGTRIPFATEASDGKPFIPGGLNAGTCGHADSASFSPPQHYNLVHASKNYSCEICHKTFSAATCFKRHKRECGFDYCCSVCGDTFRLKNSLYMHMKRKGHLSGYSVPREDTDRSGSKIYYQRRRKNDGTLPETDQAQSEVAPLPHAMETGHSPSTATGNSVDSHSEGASVLHRLAALRKEGPAAEEEERPDHEAPLERDGTDTLYSGLQTLVVEGSESESGAGPCVVPPTESPLPLHTEQQQQGSHASVDLLKFSLAGDSAGERTFRCSTCLKVYHKRNSLYVHQQRKGHKGGFTVGMPISNGSSSNTEGEPDASRPTLLTPPVAHSTPQVVASPSSTSQVVASPGNTPQIVTSPSKAPRVATSPSNTARALVSPSKAPRRVASPSNAPRRVSPNGPPCVVVSPKSASQVVTYSASTAAAPLTAMSLTSETQVYLTAGPQPIILAPQTSNTRLQDISTRTIAMVTRPEAVSSGTQNLSLIPQAVSIAPQNLSTRPQAVSIAPQNLSTRPQAVSTAPQNLSTRPQAVSTAPQNLSTRPQAVSTAPQNLSTRPQAVSTAPQNLSTRPQAVSTAPQNLSTRPQAVCGGAQFLASPPLVQPKCLSRGDEVGHHVSDKSGGVVSVCAEEGSTAVQRRVSTRGDVPANDPMKCMQQCLRDPALGATGKEGEEGSSASPGPLVLQLSNAHQCSYECQCGMVFADQSSLESHERKYHSRPVVGYKCRVCGKVYLVKNSLTVHQKRKRHTGWVAVRTDAGGRGSGAQSGMPPHTAAAPSARSVGGRATPHTVAPIQAVFDSSPPVLPTVPPVGSSSGYVVVPVLVPANHRLAVLAGSHATPIALLPPPPEERRKARRGVNEGEQSEAKRLKLLDMVDVGCQTEDLAQSPSPCPSDGSEMQGDDVHALPCPSVYVQAGAGFSLPPDLVGVLDLGTQTEWHHLHNVDELLDFGTQTPSFLHLTEQGSQTNCLDVDLGVQTEPSDSLVNHVT